MPDVHAEDDIGNVISILLFQKIGAELPFVSLSSYSFLVNVLINAIGVLPGEYNLLLESFDRSYYDSNATENLVLNTDTIKIVITPKNSTVPIAPIAPKGFSDTLAYFVTELEHKAIISGEYQDWTLP